MNTTNYPPIISVDHESNPRLYETSYHCYSPYADYSTTTSKLEAFDYNYWPTSTHNILTLPPPSAPAASSSSIPTNSNSTPPSSSQTIETLLPSSSVHLSQINSTTTFASTHHHHHIHQHLYPSATSSNDSSNWLTSPEYQSSTPYRHYSYPNNSFYDQSSWPTPTPVLPIKFESPYSPPSYYDSSHNLDQPALDSKEEPLDSSYSKCPEQTINWFKPQITPVPPKNPMNGRLLTFASQKAIEFNTRLHLSVRIRSMLNVNNIGESQKNERGRENSPFFPSSYEGRHRVS